MIHNTKQQEGILLNSSLNILTQFTVLTLQKQTMIENAQFQMSSKRQLLKN